MAYFSSPRLEEALKTFNYSFDDKLIVKMRDVRNVNDSIEIDIIIRRDKMVEVSDRRN